MSTADLRAAVERERVADEAQAPGRWWNRALDRCLALIDQHHCDEPELDVRRVSQAITNIAKRHGLVKDPPPAGPLMPIWGYTRATPDMDAEIAAEYARLGDSR
jgi:hypothetical protein